MASRAAKRRGNRKLSPDLPQQNRLFGMGEEVKIAKKSRVVDKERRHEGLAKKDRIPIDVDVTGVEGRVTAPPYWSEKRGQVMVPIKLPNEAVVCVPEDRLEKVAKLPRNGDAGGGGGFAPSRETVEFWREYFKREDKKREERDEEE